MVNENIKNVRAFSLADIVIKRTNLMVPSMSV